MLRFRIENEDHVKEVTSDFDKARGWANVVDRNDFRSYGHAAIIAASANLLEDGENYIPVDHGDHVRPRFDVIAAPKIGDKVSSGFNGDYYPQGEIVKISKSLRRVETSTGRVFWRRRDTAAWVEAGGGFSMVHGHRDERNPCF